MRASDKNVLKRFVLSHPIAGSEQSGFEASSAILFKEKLSIICPHKDNSERDVSKIEEFWKALGSYTKKLSSNDHDELFGKTSHMPHVIAYALMDSLYQSIILFFIKLLIGSTHPIFNIIHISWYGIKVVYPSCLIE